MPHLPASSAEHHRHQKNRRSLIVLSLSFFLLFSAYNTIQGFASTTLPGNLGFLSLTILYVVNVLSLVPAPGICQLLGDRKAMVLGGSCYVAFLASLISGIAPLILCSAGITGFGASILWVAQGSYLTDCSDDSNRGLNAGIFWGTFQASSIAGPLASYLILSFVSQQHRTLVMYSTFTLCGVLAVALITTLKRPLKPVEIVEFGFDSTPEDRLLSINNNNSLPDIIDNNNNNDAVERESLLQSSKQSSPLTPPLPPHISPLARFINLWRPAIRCIQLCGTKEVALLLFPFLFTGLENGFSNGEVFKLSGLAPCYHFQTEGECVLNGSRNCIWDVPSLSCIKDSSVVSLVFIAFGIGELVGSLTLGKFSDGGQGGFRRKLVVTVGTLAFAAALGVTYILQHSESESLPVFPPSASNGKSVSYLCYLATFLFGITDSAWNTQIFAAFGSLRPKEARELMTIFQVNQQFGAILGFGLPLAWPLEDTIKPIFLQYAVLFVSWLCFVVARIGVSVEDY